MHINIHKLVVNLALVQLLATCKPGWQCILAHSLNFNAKKYHLLELLPLLPSPQYLGFPTFVMSRLGLWVQNKMLAFLNWQL